MFAVNFVIQATIMEYAFPVHQSTIIAMRPGRLLLMLSFLFFAFNLVGQDVIFKRSGDSLQVKVVEVGTQEIKYRHLLDADGPLYALENYRIRSIRYASGRVEYFEENPIAPEDRAQQRVHAIKMNLLSPVLGYTRFSYEYSLKPGRSLEGSINFIGLGRDPGHFDIFTRNQAGLGLAAGYKFIKQPNYYIPGMRIRHLMHGIYAKPTLHLGFYGEDYAVYDFTLIGPTIKRRNVAYGAGIVELGSQWVFQNIFLIDLYVGLGLGLDNNREESYGARHWGVSRLGAANGLGAFLTSGFKVGLLLGKPKEDPRF
jgi:hypothetical protein